MSLSLWLTQGKCWVPVTTVADANVELDVRVIVIVKRETIVASIV